MSKNRQATLGVLLLATQGCAHEVPETPSYAAHIRPILDEHCVRCHRQDRRDGDVELDRFESARSTRVRSACTAIAPDLVERNAEYLLPSSGPAEPCRTWAVSSMPPGAIEHLDRWQQEVFVRWIVTGAAE